MGFGSSFKKAMGSNFAFDPLDQWGGRAMEKRERNALAARIAAEKDAKTRAQLQAGGVFGTLSTKQQQDLLINNPTIEGPTGSQFFDPSTNTIRLEESDFTQAQRLRQESLAEALSGSLSGDLPGVDAQSRFERGREIFKQDFQEERGRLEQQLADQGIPRGSEAFNAELNRLDTSQNRRLQEVSRESVATVEAQRAARFNEISSLLGTQQVGGVGFSQFQPQASGLDLFGAEQAGLNRAFQASQASKARSAAQKQALIGAAGTFGAAAVSDRTLKENIEVVGKAKSGLTIYHFDYKNKDHGQGRFEGVMAQDLIKINPHAIIPLDNGKMAVDYSQIDVEFKRVANGS